MRTRERIIDAIQTCKDDLSRVKQELDDLKKYGGNVSQAQRGAELRNRQKEIEHYERGLKTLETELAEFDKNPIENAELARQEEEREERERAYQEEQLAHERMVREQAEKKDLLAKLITETNELEAREMRHITDFRDIAAEYDHLATQFRLLGADNDAVDLARKCVVKKSEYAQKYEAAVKKRKTRIIFISAASGFVLLIGVFTARNILLKGTVPSEPPPISVSDAQTAAETNTTPDDTPVMTDVPPAPEANGSPEDVPVPPTTDIPEPTAEGDSHNDDQNEPDAPPEDIQLPDFPGILEVGSEGEDVQLLQECLNKTGNELVTDGDFGEKTKAAVMEFQTLNGLNGDGTVDEDTWRVLMEKVYSDTIDY